MLVPGGADSEISPPTREYVQRGHRLDHQRRVAVNDAAHQQPDLDLVRDPGEEAQCRIALQHLRFWLAQPRSELEEVVHHPQAIETALVRRLNGICQPAAQRSGRARSEMRDLQSYLHSLPPG